MKKVILFFVVVFSMINIFAANFSVSFMPYYFIISAIADKDDKVNTIVPPGKSPHTYSLSPIDLKNLSSSNLVFVNGLNMEVFLDKLIKNFDQKKIIDISNFIPKKFLLKTADIEKDMLGAEGHDHDEGIYNPHIWLDPVLMYTYAIPEITKKMIQAVPSKKEVYTKNSEKLIKEIKNTDLEIKNRASKIKYSIFTFHEAFPYYAKRYGINIAGVVQVAPGKDPSPKLLQELVKKGKEKNVKAIFYEPQFNPKPANVIAAEMNIKTGILDPEGDGTSRIKSLKELYLDIINQIETAGR